MDAVQAFVKLLKEMPLNENRWESAHTSILAVTEQIQSPLGPYLHTSIMSIRSAWRWILAKIDLLP